MPDEPPTDERGGRGAWLGWGLAGALASACAAAVGTFALGHFIPPTGQSHPLSAEKKLELIALCGAVGLGVGGLSGSLLERSSPGGVIWGLGGALTGALGGWFTSALITVTHGQGPEELRAALAWAVPGLFAGVAGYCRQRQTKLEPVEGDEAGDDDAQPSRLASALAWGLAGAVVSGGVRAVAFVGVPALGLHVSPVGTDEPLTAATVVELIGMCAGVGLIVGALVGSLVDGAGPVEAWFVWGVGGAMTGVIGGGLTPVFITSARGSAPAELWAVLAWAIAGLFAGVAGYCRSRVMTPEPPDDHNDDADDTRVKRPRVFWVRGTPAGRLVPVFAVAAGCVVASLVSPPSMAGWAVVAVGLLGLAVGCALVGQERRIAALERRLKEVSKPNEPEA